MKYVDGYGLPVPKKNLKAEAWGNAHGDSRYPMTRGERSV
jgi:hypothetical protein